MVVESRSGGLYARLSPFNLHNITGAEQVPQLGIHNTGQPHNKAYNIDTIGASVCNQDFFRRILVDFQHCAMSVLRLSKI